ncbi:MAG: NAD-binding protein [Solirubrobacterales bacterium]
MSASDKAYRSLQLFVTDAQFPPGGSPWQLEIARFLAPLSIAYAVLATIAALAREEVQRLRTRWFTRGHTVIVGLGVRGLKLARSLSATHKLVAVERDAANGSAKSLRASGIPVIVGDARDESVLRSAGSTRAARVVVLTSDDTVNLQIAAGLVDLAEADPPSCHVAIEDPALWSELHRVPIQVGSRLSALDFFSIPDREAKTIVNAGRAKDPSPRDALVRGEGATAARVIVHALRSFPDLESIELCCDKREAVMPLLERGDDWVIDSGKLSAVDRRDIAPFDLAFVCGMPDAASLGVAVDIVRHVPTDAPIFLAADDPRISAALEVAGIEVDRITLVSTRARVFGESLFADSSIEIVARAKHADYVIQQRARGDTPETNASIVDWEDLAPSLRDSNRRYAAGVASKLAALRLSLVPLSGPLSDPDLAIPPPTLEEMAEEEHERWMRDLEADGWRPTDGPKDPDAKLHPMLIPWSELTEEEREKDRDGVRQLPSMLAAIGYELRSQGGSRV